jgi:hypothetical protein
VLAGATAAIGVTLLPFWPPALAIAVALGAAAAALLNPRLGMAIALATPLFPFGNDARSAALVYGGFALAWLAVTWRESRFGLLFVAGPLLAPLGALALVPLAVQPLRSPFLRGLQGALAVLAAALLTGLDGETGVAPGATVTDVATALLSSLAAQPALIAAAAVAGLAGAFLPWIKQQHRFAVAGVGLVLIVASIAGGSGALGAFLALAGWGVAALLAAGSRR